MAKFNDLLVEGGFAIGWTSYEDCYPGDEANARIVLTATIAGNPPIQMIVDTGSAWCILDPELATEWGLMSAILYSTTKEIIIRGFPVPGSFLRAPIVLQATNGQELEVEATFFIPKLDPGQKWGAPNFIGLSGFLNYIRFAIDAQENAFYFGHD
jgi:hypothetical protein